MPKGYGYDKPPKKASGFKMRGFSYPGQSPIKGKRKKAEAAAAQQQRADAMEGLQGLEIKGESTNILQGTNTAYGNIDSPFNKRTLVQDIHRTPIKQGDLPLQTISPQAATQMPVSTPEGPTTSLPYEPQQKTSNWQKFKSAASKAAGSKIGETVGTAVAEGLVNLGMSAISRRKKEPKRK
jgi:hypothetical protein